MVLSFWAVLSISLGVFFGCVVQRGSLQSLSEHRPIRDSGYREVLLSPVEAKGAVDSPSFVAGS